MKEFSKEGHEYFSDNNILSSSQFGFRSGARTENVLLKFSDDILQCFDKNKIAIATFMDLTKAFHCVNHDILKPKLRRCGINFNALQWIKSYLSLREPFVSWNQTNSPTLIKFTHGCSPRINSCTTSVSDLHK